MPEGSPEQPEALSKTDTLNVLRDTIRRLEGLVNRLEAASVEALPPTAAFDNLASSLETLEASIEEIAPPIAESEARKPVASPTKPTELRGIDRVLPSFDRLQAGWDSILNRIRALLPTSINEKLSDWAITGILAGLVVFLFSTAVLLLPEKPEEPIAAIETPPPPIEEPAVEPEVPPEIEVPPIEEPEVPPEIEVPPIEEPEVSPEIEVPPATEPVPPEIEAPGEPEPVVVEPPPEPVLTPEQSLIAAIQNQVAAITSQYAEGLIHAIQADFVGSRLLVQIEDEWYNLTETRQNQVAREMWTRSQELDFRKLEIIDLEGNLLARSPVVGKDMVIFARDRT